MTKKSETPEHSRDRQPQSNQAPGAPRPLPRIPAAKGPSQALPGPAAQPSASTQAAPVPAQAAGWGVDRWPDPAATQGSSPPTRGQAWRKRSAQEVSRLLPPPTQGPFSPRCEKNKSTAPPKSDHRSQWNLGAALRLRSLKPLPASSRSRRDRSRKNRNAGQGQEVQTPHRSHISAGALAPAGSALPVLAPLGRSHSRFPGLPGMEIG